MHAASSQKCTADSFAQLLSFNPDLSVKDNIGRTVLHFACRAGRLDIFQLLIAVDDIDLDCVSNAGVTPLMMAIESGDIQLVAEGLNNNLNPFLKDALGR